MEFALSEDKKRIKAAKYTKGFCEICREPLIPKCGAIYKAHWSHKAGKDCDPWWEPESDWHRNWKNLVDENFREVVIEKNGEKHRADIQLLSGIVIELQNSPLSISERCERENFYERMIWIIHLPKAKIELIKHCYEENLFSDYYAQIKNINEWIYREPHACPIFLDLDDNDKIFHITEFTDDNSNKKRTKKVFGKYIDKKKFFRFLRPTFFDFDLYPICLSHKHRDFENIQNKLCIAQMQLELIKEELRIAKKQKKREEQVEKWRKQNEESQKLRETENQKILEKEKIVNDAKRNYIWGAWTETDERATFFEEELKKLPKKDPWEV